MFRFFLAAVLAIAIFACPIAPVIADQGAVAMEAKLKTYKAFVYPKDKESFTDYCQSSSWTEAYKTFHARYPDARLSVVEVNTKD